MASPCRVPYSVSWAGPLFSLPIGCVFILMLSSCTLDSVLQDVRCTLEEPCALPQAQCIDGFCVLDEELLEEPREEENHNQGISDSDSDSDTDLVDADLDDPNDPPCPDGQLLCDDQCTLVTANHDHCGACDVPCLYTCTDGTCPITCDPGSTPFGGGDGSPDAPYTLCTVEHFLNIPANSTNTFYLLENLDLQNVTNYQPIKAFHGHFNGNHHGLFNLTIDDPTLIYAGLFESIEADALVENLFIVDIEITAGMEVGTLASKSRGTLNNILSIGNILLTSEPIFIGGIIGSKEHGTLYRTSFRGTISSNDGIVGGLIGSSGNNSSPALVTAIQQSYSITEITFISSFSFGGIVGQNLNRLETIDTYCRTQLKCQNQEEGQGGSFIGQWSDLSISNSYSTLLISESCPDFLLIGPSYLENPSPPSISYTFWQTTLQESTDPNSPQESTAGDASSLGIERGDVDETFFSNWDTDTIWLVPEEIGTELPILQWETTTQTPTL